MFEFLFGPVKPAVRPIPPPRDYEPSPNAGRTLEEAARRARLIALQQQREDRL